jgi:hypothetical protein
MSPRRFKPYRPFKPFEKSSKSPKSPFDHDGPNQKALKDALDWIATHDPNTPFSRLIKEVHKPAPPVPEEPPKPDHNEKVPADSEELPISAPDESVEPATNSVQAAPPEPPPSESPAKIPSADPEPPKQEERARKENEKEVAGAVDPAEESESVEDAYSQYDPDEIAARIRSFIRPPQRPPVNSRRIRRVDDDDPVNISRHRRLCVICNHDDRYAIDQAFLEWRRPIDIKQEFRLPDRRCVSRHARATGLFEKRARNLRAGLEKVIEESTIRPPSADSIIRAVRVYGCLDANGRWVEPPRNLIITHHTVREPRPEQNLPASEPKNLINVDPTVIDLEKGA